MRRLALVNLVWGSAGLCAAAGCDLESTASPRPAPLRDAAIEAGDGAVRHGRCLPGRDGPQWRLIDADGATVPALIRPGCASQRVHCYLPGFSGPLQTGCVHVESALGTLIDLSYDLPTGELTPECAETNNFEVYLRYGDPDCTGDLYTMFETPVDFESAGHRPVEWLGGDPYYVNGSDYAYRTTYSGPSCTELSSWVYAVDPIPDEIRFLLSNPPYRVEAGP